MSENNILATVDSVLAGKELQDQPRAFLLLRLCQLSLRFSPDKTEHYWSQLVPLQKQIPEAADFENLRSIMESTSTSSAKGFAAEVIADIEAAKKLAADNTEEAKQCLRDCESRLQKRRWPFGKTPARVALVEAWAGIECQYALQLIGTIPGDTQENFIRRINHANLLLPEEWDIVADKAGMNQTVDIVIKILDDNKQPLYLPSRVLLQVGESVRASMQSIDASENEDDLLSKFAIYNKLIMSQMESDLADLIPELIEDFYIYLVKAHNLDEIWSSRFTIIANLLNTWVISKSSTEETLERLLGSTPSYLINFVRSHYAALSASPTEVEDVYAALLSKTGQDRDAEAWFLVTLVRRDLGAEAMALAEKSDNAEELLPRLRRAWLCLYPGLSESVISAMDMSGDSVGGFLAQGSVQDRVAYLKSSNGHC